LAGFYTISSFCCRFCSGFMGHPVHGITMPSFSLRWLPSPSSTTSAWKKRNVVNSTMSTCENSRSNSMRSVNHCRFLDTLCLHSYKATRANFSNSVQPKLWRIMKGETRGQAAPVWPTRYWVNMLFIMLEIAICYIWFSFAAFKSASHPLFAKLGHPKSEGKCTVHCTIQRIIWPFTVTVLSYDPPSNPRSGAAMLYLAGKTIPFLMAAYYQVMDKYRNDRRPGAYRNERGWGEGV